LVAQVVQYIELLGQPLPLFRLIRIFLGWGLLRNISKDNKGKKCIVETEQKGEMGQVTEA